VNRREYEKTTQCNNHYWCRFVDREARRKDLLKDVKSTVERKLFYPKCEVLIEYGWEEEEK